MSILLTREEFKRQVFLRDKNKCICCSAPAVDAHHIIDRSLFEDGGYYIDNGVSLCADHHLQAEYTTLSCKELRKTAGITTILLPEHLDTEEEWDHWGNIILPTGVRLKGELFFLENVQKALKEGGAISIFMPYVKYSRTYHLPTSPNLQNDDRQHQNVDELMKSPIIGSIKLDGENTSIYSDYIHARSVDSKHHESRAWVKALHGQIKHEIPDGWRISGENVFAKHSIHYQHLKSYFYVFSIWNERNEALSWAETEEYCDILGLHTVPVFCRGILSLEDVQKEFDNYCACSPDPVEGYVIRNSGTIPYHRFKNMTAKYVRANHVQTEEFWMSQPVVPNIIESGPIYSDSEMLQLLSIIRYSDSPNLDLVITIKDLFTSLPDYCKDSVRFKFHLKSIINRNVKYLTELEMWSNATIEKKVVVEKSLYATLYCDFSEVPLHLSGNFPHICKWRLEHGK